MTKTFEQLEAEITELRYLLEEANETLEAIQTGKVDALIVKDEKGHQLYTLKTADQTYRVFIEKMREGAVTLSTKNIILYSNSQFASLMDLPLSKVIGSHFEKFVAPEYRETFDKLAERGWSRESKGEIYLLNQNNELIPFLISLTTLELDEGVALSIILSDLSLQKETESLLKLRNEELQRAYAIAEKLNDELEDKVKERTKELLVSREHFKFLADTIPVIVWTALPNGEYDYFNQQWYKYTGKTFEQSKGSGWQSVIHPDDLSSTLIAWHDSITKGTPFKREDRKLSAAGEYRWHLAHALPFKDGNGNVIAWFGVCTDIDDQKRAMAKKDEFISMASHELKTPVTSLKAFTQILQMTFEEQGNDMAFSMLGKMDKQINKLTDLITDLLDVSRANEGQLKFDTKPFDFNEMVKEIAEEMQHTTKTHTIELLLANTIEVSGDRNRLGQVLTNLISNAIKYSPGADRILVTSTISNNKITLCVQDFGIGISETQQAGLFTRFFRASHDVVNTFPGLGLGLYISNEIIKHHSGSFTYKSEVNKGSTFCFSLPLQ